MKNVLALLIVFMLAVLASSGAQATTLTLEDGLFDTGSSAWCAFRIVNDQTTGEMMVIAQNGSISCRDLGTTRTFKRLDAVTFITEIPGEPQIVDSKLIAKCRPKTGNPQPCGNGLYDPSTGALRIQVGDKVERSDAFHILNPRAFRVDSYFRQWRKGQYFDSWLAKFNSLIFYRTSN